MSERPLAAAVSGLGVVDPARAVIAATDEGFTRGRAAFETLRVYGGRPFRLEEHLARLAGSADRLGLPEPDPGVLRELVDNAMGAPQPGIRTTPGRGVAVGAGDASSVARSRTSCNMSGAIPNDAAVAALM